MRTSAAVLSAALALAAPLRADTIHLYQGDDLANVRVVAETYREVQYTLPGTREPQSKPADVVKGVTYELPSEKYTLAAAARGAGDLEKAALLFQAAAANPGKRNEWEIQYGLFQAADCLRLAGKCPEAVAALDDLLQQVPETKFYGDVFVRQAECFKAQGDRARARATFEKLREEVKSRGLSERWDILAEYHLLRLGEGASREAYESVAERAGDRYPDVANLARLRVGYVLIEEGKIDEARAYFQEIIDARQASEDQIVAGAYAGLGNTYVNKPNATPADFAKALFPFLRVIYNYETRAGADTLAEALYWAGRCFEARAKDPELNSQRSKELYRRVIKEYPSSVWAKRANER